MSTSESGTFKRDTRYLDGRITVDGRDGWPVRPGTYRLVVARGCPWANRTMIVRRLLGLEPVLSMGICGPEHDSRSWTFDLDPGGVDPVLGIHWLREAYEKAVPGYDRGVTVPAIVDIPTGAVVTADFPRITLDMEQEWTAYHRPGAPDLYPAPLRDEIEEVSAHVYQDVNNGVYRCGFATTQDAYDAAYATLFAGLDWLEQRLAGRRYLVGDTIDFVQTKQHYYRVHANLNPGKIVPAGPDLSGWLTPHGREALGGRPFGDGTPPGPPPAAERVAPGHGAG